MQTPALGGNDQRGLFPVTGGQGGVMDEAGGVEHPIHPPEFRPHGGKAALHGGVVGDIAGEMAHSGGAILGKLAQHRLGGGL